MMFDVVEFCRIAHKGQVRRHSGAPYFTHLVEVAGYTSAVTTDPMALKVAWCHDLLEDTNTEWGDLALLIGVDCADAVRMLTDTDDKGDTRQARHQSALRRLGDAYPWAQTVKLADICSNLSTLHLLPKLDRWVGNYFNEKVETIHALTKAHPEMRSFALRCARRTQELLDAPNK